MTPVPFDPRYVAARGRLLDALEALPLHRSSLILVGAQAVYLRVGSAGIDDVVPLTLDVDLAIAPQGLVQEPALGVALSEAGFIRPAPDTGQPGRWSSGAPVGGPDAGVMLDLMVPSVSARDVGRRVRTAGLAERDARSTSGLAAVLADHTLMAVASLDPADARSIELKVAGSAALLIAKMHKFGERIEDGNQRRLRPLPKDALDAHRLLRGERPDTLAETFRRLLTGDEAMAREASYALGVLRRDFAAPGAPGARLAAEAGRLSREAAELALLTARFTHSLLALIDPRG